MVPPTNPAVAAHALLSSRRVRPPLLSFVPRLAVALAAASGAHAAHAASITLRDGDVLLTTADRETWVNRARCVCGANLSVTLDLSDYSSDTRAALVVGKSCLDSESAIASSCRTLWSGKVGSDTTRTVDASAADLAGSCAVDDTTLTLSIVVDPEDDDTWTSATSLTLGVDTTAPSAPKKDSLKAGESLVEASYTAAKDADDEEGLRYQVLCSTEAGEVALDDAPEAVFTSPWDLCADADSDEGLREAFVCGEASEGTASVTITGLVNGQAYVFSVVAVDAQGNASARTSLGRATPSKEEDYWERYQRSGGLADGTGCSAAPGGEVLALGAVVALAGLRRARR